MEKLLAIFAVLSILSQANGFSFWNDFRVTWAILPILGYDRLPMNTTQAAKDGWVMHSGSDCKNGGEFYGFQYFHPSDHGIAILFDVNGYAGGVQSLLPHGEMIVEGGKTEWAEVPMYQNQTIHGVTYFVITVYFTKPESLCIKSNSTDGNIGAKSQVYFQNGGGIENLKIAYKNREEASANGWTVNNCVPGMGWHNFYQVEKYEDHDCKRIQPTCILYNEVGEMFGFCLLFQGTGSSKRYEHPNSAGVQAVLGETPQCLIDQTDKIGATTIHFYFQDKPWAVGC